MAKSIEEMTRNFRYALGLSMKRNQAESVRKAGRDYRAALARTQRVNAGVTALLRRARVEPTDYVYYLACAQQLERARRKYACLVLANEARVLLNYWAARGMSRAVLNGVCREVLGFDPASPDERPCACCPRRRGCKLIES